VYQLAQDKLKGIEADIEELGHALRQLVALPPEPAGQ
jgi:hypothetical protein